MKTTQSTMALMPSILYFVAGVCWVGILVAGGGYLLFWGAATCFLSGVFLLTLSTSWITRPLSISSAIFGLTLTIYQLYLGLTLIGTGLDPLAAITAGVFGALTAIYLYLLIFSRPSPEEEKGN